MTQKKQVNHTMDCYRIGNVLSNDPKCRAELIQGIKDYDKGVRLKTTSALGAANLREGEGHPDRWFTLFVATVKDATPGQPKYIWRNDAKGSARGAGDGPRIQMRLKFQEPKNQAAETTPGAVLSHENLAAQGYDLSDPATQNALAILQAAKAVDVAAAQEVDAPPPLDVPPATEVDADADLSLMPY